MVVIWFILKFTTNKPPTDNQQATNKAVFNDFLCDFT